MSVVKTVGTGLAWNTTAMLVGKIIVFVNVFLILQHLTVYEYGLSELVLSVISTVGIFLLPGLSSAIIADLGAERARGEYGRMKALFLQFVSFNVLLACIAWALLFFGSDTAAAWAGNPTIGYLLKFASFQLLTSPFRTVSTMLAAVELRYADQSLYGTFEEIFKLGNLALFFLVLHRGIDGLLLSIVCSQALTILLYAPRTLSAARIFYGAETQESYEFWNILRRHRKWSIASTYVGQLGQTLQIWLIRAVLGTEAVGLYAFASGIFSQISSLSPLSTVLAPLLPRYVDNREMFARYIKSSVKAQALFTVASIAISIVGLPVLAWIFPKYIPAIPIVFIMLIGLIPNGNAFIYTAAFNALKEQYQYFQSSVFKTLLILVVTWPSVHFFGTLGMGISYDLLLIGSVIERSKRLKRLLPEFNLTIREFFQVDPYERELLLKAVNRVRSVFGRV
jgi:O-antigen/teichoic acid export membrane protein